MMCKHIDLLDLPNEILLLILKKLNNMNVLYSLIGIGIERLDLLAQNPVFTNTLTFVSTDVDDISWIDTSILNRFCTDILLRIHHNVQCLVFESTIMEQILLAADYPYLTKLQIFDFNQEIVERYFTDGSFSLPIHKQHITDLILVNSEKDDQINEDNYSLNVYARILSFFENLKHLTIVESFIEYCSYLTLRDLSSSTFSSSTLVKLCINVGDFDDCLCLLDGRLEQLSTLIIGIVIMENLSLVMNSSDDLPRLHYLSLRCDNIEVGYDTHIVPLLRRMRNLEELTLYLRIYDRDRFIDGTQLHNEILVHMSQLHSFRFYVRTDSVIDHSVPYVSNDDVRRTFTNIGYEQVACIAHYFSTERATCHVFSLPFTFDTLEVIGNAFPNLMYSNVIRLAVLDMVPLKQEFFVRIARCFPLLKSLCVMNLGLQVANRDQLEADDNQSYSVAEYPHMTKLDIKFVHIDYVEQFLHESKTHLPRLIELKIKYQQLSTVTENFTRNATRSNCLKVKQLILDEAIVHPEDFYHYFPLL